MRFELKHGTKLCSANTYPSDLHGHIQVYAKALTELELAVQIVHRAGDSP